MPINALGVSVDGAPVALIQPLTFLAGVGGGSSFLEAAPPPLAAMLAAKAQAQQMEMLQANYASVVGLLETAEGEKQKLLSDAASLQQRLEAAEAELQAARQDAIEKNTAADQMTTSAAEKDAALTASRAEIAQLQRDMEALHSSAHAAEAAAAVQVH